MGRGIRRLFKDNRGDAAVLITVLFACIIGLTAVILAATKASAGQSCADAASRLAGRSVLAEYDTRLLSDYGLLAFRGDEKQIEQDLAFYAGATLKSGGADYARFFPASGGSKMIDTSVRYEAGLKQFSLMDVELFEAQVKAAAEKKAIDALRNSEDAGVGFGDLDGEPDTQRTLRNRAVKAALPSAGYTKPGIAGFTEVDIPVIGTVFEDGDERIPADEYILKVFGHAGDGVYAEERFFADEVEYIIAGGDSDRANYAGVKNYLTMIRSVMNKEALLADAEKQERIRALAESFAEEGSAGADAAALSIMELWISAETKNDLRLLEKGDLVAFRKDSSQWATQQLEDIIDGRSLNAPEYPVDGNGLCYRDYLRGLLRIMDREAKFLRVMDLIQINLKTDYDRDFLLREYYTGFRFCLKVGGDEFLYTEKY